MQRCDGLSESARRALAFKREYAIGQRLRQLAEDHALVGPSVSLFGPLPVHQAETPLDGSRAKDVLEDLRRDEWRSRRRAAG